MKSECDFCKDKKMSVVYDVLNSRRGAVVYICERCGLVQSKFTQSNIKKKKTISSDADWGNLRIGKTLMFDRVRPILEEKIPRKNVTTILDIGSSRGDFVLWASAKAPKAKITAIEPDSSVTTLYKNNSSIFLIQKRFEEVSIEKNFTDFVYCMHTLEHASSAYHMLERIFLCMKQKSLLFLEVPSLGVIDEDDIVEEFFLDKHSFHFDCEILSAFFSYLGFEIMYEGKKESRWCSYILSKKRKNLPQGKFSYSSKTIQSTKKRIQEYSIRLEKNRKKLKKIGALLNEFMERQSVVYWGAGRIFDALVAYGNLDTQKMKGLVDSYVGTAMKYVSGVEVRHPDFLRSASPNVVVVLANSSSEQIAHMVRKFGIQNVILFRDLMHQDFS